MSALKKQQAAARIRHKIYLLNDSYFLLLIILLLSELFDSGGTWWVSELETGTKYIAALSQFCMVWFFLPPHQFQTI